MYQPGENDIGQLEAVPCGVLKEPVAAGAVVDKDHDGDCDASENVQRIQSDFFRRRRRRRLLLFISDSLVLFHLHFLRLRGLLLVKPESNKEILLRIEACIANTV